jgi:TRIAP1/MDM35 family protein
LALFAMAHSLSPKCTPLKREYDSCFNSWFEGYLEPAVAANASHDERAAFSKKKADEFHAKCGMIWEQYRQCVQVRRISCVASVLRPKPVQNAVKEKGLDNLLAQAREEYPLTTPPPPQTPRS